MLCSVREKYNLDMKSESSLVKKARSRTDELVMTDNTREPTAKEPGGLCYHCKTVGESL